MHQDITGEHRGVRYFVPGNDTGAWRWFLRSDVVAPGLFALNATPRPTYPTRDAALKAAREAIDRHLSERLRFMPLRDKSIKMHSVRFP